MNKKIAALLFAIGLGAPSSPSWAYDCKHYCAAGYRICIDSGRPEAECFAERAECFEMYCTVAY